MDNAQRNGAEQFGGGIAGAVALHVALAGALVGYAVVHRTSRDRWGEQTSSVGAIQASLVNALPLPPKAEPVEKQVLVAEDTSPAPKPPPKEAAAPPPKPTDIELKAKTPDKKPPPKTAPNPAPEPPKHPQPTPPSPKADTGASATQLPQSIAQLKNGTSAITVEDRTFGARYAYYIRGIQRTVTQSYYQQDIDAHSAQDRSVTLLFDVGQDGTLSNLRFATHSGSSSLDLAGMRALQRIDTGFGPLPAGAGDHITVQYTFGFHLD